METVPECVRCTRSEHDHLLQDRDEADDTQRRIWRALGYPCPQFTDELAAVFAGNQAATGRWAHGPRRPGLASPRSSTYSQGAAAARAALAHRKEAR